MARVSAGRSVPHGARAPQPHWLLGQTWVAAGLPLGRRRAPPAGRQPDTPAAPDPAGGDAIEPRPRPRLRRMTDLLGLVRDDLGALDLRNSVSGLPVVYVVPRDFGDSADS